MKPQQDPRTYLSTSDGVWRLIDQGMPLCRDGTREQAEDCARRFRLALPDIHWNGDVGEWVRS